MRLPGDDNRTMIIGRTGSGKTVAGIWHLSQRSWRKMPWIIFDYKGDSLIAKLPATELKKLEVPKKPGLYVVRPIAKVSDPEIEEFLWKIKYHGNVGLYFDEGYMLPFDGKSDAYNAILTQGRSLKIPTITLSQRPVWLSRFAITEAEFLQIFWLNDERDRKTLTAVIPKGINERLPEYHSYYYDVKKDDLLKLAPVPSENEILAKFDIGKPKTKSFFL